MHDITIVTVNWNADDFLDLMLESIDRFGSESADVIVVDNSLEQHRPIHPCVTYMPQPGNIGHGKGLNIGLSHARRKYSLVLDVDCHFLRKGWEYDFRSALSGYDLVAGRGVPAKPIRASTMFMETALGRRLDWRDTPGYRGHRITPEGFDVAIGAYHELIDGSASIFLLDSMPSRYGTLNGEEWCVGGSPAVYHHWHGSHLKERSVDFPGRDLEADKSLLMRSVGWRVAENHL